MDFVLTSHDDVRYYGTSKTRKDVATQIAFSNNLEKTTEHAQKVKDRKSVV
jgi:hypothetical protein